MSEHLPTTQERKIIGEAKVLQTFDIGVKGKTARVGGCRVAKGTIQSTSNIIVKRGDQIVFEGSFRLSFSLLAVLIRFHFVAGDIRQLKIVKDEVPKVEEGSECGIMLKNFDQIEKGDVIQAFVLEDVKREFVPS